MSDAPLVLSEVADKVLTTDEHVEWMRFLASEKPRLSLGASLKLYELHLQGVSCSEIAKLNPAISLGAILAARIDHKWDERREAYRAELYANANERLRQLGAESLDFMSIALAAAHKDLGGHMKKYLMSGDPNDLGPFRIVSFKTYKDVIETVVKLTGQDNKKTVKVEGEVKHTGEPGTGARLTPEQADALRAVMGKG